MSLEEIFLQLTTQESTGAPALTRRRSTLLQNLGAGDNSGASSASQENG